MDVKEEIYKTIENIVERYVTDQNQSEQFSGIVLDVQNDKYTVLINGSKYLLKDGVGINPTPNTTVWVCVPNNDWNKAYICAGKSNINSGVGNVKDVFQNNISVLGSDNIARVRCATPEDIQQLQANFQAGVDAIGNACTRKGSPPASSSLEDTVAAIDAIQTGGNYMTKEIREDGIYYASDDDVDAYDVVVVSKDIGQPHTVVFYDKDGETIIQTQANVPYHGSASCTLLDGTFYNGLYFKGWNPSPSNIVRDTFCYPVYGDYIITPGEIADDWETICANGGANYPLGSYKAFVVAMTVPAGEIMCTATGHNDNQRAGYLPRENWGYSPNIDLPINFTTQMVKVAEGEDNSTSTWLSKGVFYINYQPDRGYSRWRDGSGEWTVQESNLRFVITDFSDNYSYTQAGGYGTAIMHDWGSSYLRNFLNGFFFNHLPIYFRDAIKEVNKSYKGYDTDIYSQKSRVEKTSLDKIWVPSVKELSTCLQQCTIGSMSPNTFENIVEINGIDYSSVYSPSYPYEGASYECAITRTSVQGGSGYAYDYNIVRMNTADANLLASASYRWSNNTSEMYIPFGFCL